MTGWDPTNDSPDAEGFYAFCEERDLDTSTQEGQMAAEDAYRAWKAEQEDRRW